jgi:NAD(P)-dependent dehydrogenase (short-subunit alcohol dehydrogenase family)
MERVVITGAAGGIGGATVDAFLGAGFEVVGIDRRAATERPGYVGRVADLVDPESVRHALADVGPIRHVVAIAGGALPVEKTTRDVADLPLDAFRQSIEQNLTTAFITLQAALPNLRAADGDRSLSFTASTDALISYGLPAYAAAKAGIVGLVRSLAGPLGHEGVRINAVAPGDIPTPRNQHEWAHVPDWYERVGELTALGRLGTTDELAQAFLALATSLTSMTGQTLVVDAGVTIAGPQPIAPRD